jgi:hypothetical protein
MMVKVEAKADGVKLRKRGILDMADTVPASEFTKNFGRYKMQAQREAVAVSSHGQIAGYFVGAHEYEELLRLKNLRRSFATTDLPEETIRAIEAVRMDPRHDHLDAMLEDILLEPKT